MSRIATAIFGCGCFWHKEHLFRALHGVTATRVGFMGGWKMDPSYQEVCQKSTGHAEVVEVSYDTTKTRFPTLLKAFFSFHDATRDRTIKGGQYRSVVFYRKAKERIITERALELLAENGLQTCTQLLPAQIFWEAETEHQSKESAAVGNDAVDSELDKLSIIQAAAMPAPVSTATPARRSAA